MALIDCSECGKQISDKAESCPNCGNPIKPQNKEDLMKCPYCKSTQLTTSQKGFSAGKALAGGVLLGGVGLLAGTLGSGNVKITCLKCGHNFKAGDYEKEVEKFSPKPKTEKEIESNKKLAKALISILIVIGLAWGIAELIVYCL